MQSVKGRNLRLMGSRFGMDDLMCAKYGNKCVKMSDAELYVWHDKCVQIFLDKEECKPIILFLCTN